MKQEKKFGDLIGSLGLLKDDKTSPENHNMFSASSLGVQNHDRSKPPQKSENKMPKNNTLRGQFFAEPIHEKNFGFKNDRRKNPIRHQLLVFLAAFHYFILCQGMLWVNVIKASDDRKFKISGFCYWLNALRGLAVIAQTVNLVMWICRSSFSKRWHIAHFSTTVLMLILQYQVLDCLDEAQDSAVILHSCTITALVALISWQTALTSLHTVLAVAVTLAFQAYTVLSLSSVKESTFFGILIVINSMLVPIILLCSFSLLTVRNDKLRETLEM